jgi:hypothetical protein
MKVGSQFVARRGFMKRYVENAIRIEVSGESVDKFR